MCDLLKIVTYLTLVMLCGCLAQETQSERSTEASKASDYFPDANNNEQVGQQRQASTTIDMKPLKNLMMGLYHNYRSSYVGDKSNRTSIQTGAEASNKIDQNDKRKTVHRLKKTTKRKSAATDEDELKYNVGPGVNISIDVARELVSVFLDEDCLKDVFTGMSITS